MTRRNCFVFAAATIGFALLMADSRPAEAQGLLRRIQDRIQSRTAPPVPRYQPPRAVQPQPTRSSPTPSAQTSATQMRRVSPIGTDAKPGATSPQSGTPAKIDEKTYGDSILSRSGSAANGGMQKDDKASQSDLAKETTDAERPTIGISVFEPADGTPGIEVARFNETSMADEAGLQVGDVIVAINGKPTPSSRAVAELLREFAIGDRVRVQLYRDQKPLSLTLPLTSSLKPTVASKPRSATDRLDATTRQADLASLGKPATDEVEKAIDKVEEPKSNLEAASGIAFGAQAKDAPGVRGAIVTEVAPGSPAAVAGVTAGDRIVSIDGRLLIDSRSLDRQLQNQKDGDEVSIQLVRGSTLMAKDVLFTSKAPAKVESSDSKEVQAAKSGGSLAEGFGSVLGGLFSNKKSQVKADTSDDEMAFGDEDTIQPVDFQESVTTDPPSLEVMELPVGELVAPANSKADEKTAETLSQAKLLERIRKLESELEQLKATDTE